MSFITASILSALSRPAGVPVRNFPSPRPLTAKDRARFGTNELPCRNSRELRVSGFEWPLERVFWPTRHPGLETGPEEYMRPEKIVIRGAREHNLKHVAVEIP